jgi:hypothetical protein
MNENYQKITFFSAIITIFSFFTFLICIPFINNSCSYIHVCIGNDVCIAGKYDGCHIYDDYVNMRQPEVFYGNIRNMPRSTVRDCKVVSKLTLLKNLTDLENINCQSSSDCSIKHVRDFDGEIAVIFDKTTGLIPESACPENENNCQLVDGCYKHSNDHYDKIMFETIQTVSHHIIAFMFAMLTVSVISLIVILITYNRYYSNHLENNDIIC